MASYKQLEELFENKLCDRLFFPSKTQWARGVKYCARWLVDYVCPNENDVLTLDDYEEKILNGASDWREYAEGGLPCAYDWDILTLLFPHREAEELYRRVISENPRCTLPSTFCTEVMTAALFDASKRIKRMIEFIDKP